MLDQSNVNPSSRTQTRAALRALTPAFLALALSSLGRTQTTPQTTPPATPSTPAPTATLPTPRPRAPRPAAKPAEPKVIQVDMNLVVLDPAHGGTDPGGRLGPNLLEKDNNLEFAYRLRSLLQAQGFTVLLTREADPVAKPAPEPVDGQPAPPPPPPPAQITNEGRAEVANRVHPVACLTLHTTAAGHGIHLYTSALNPPSAFDEPREVPLWDTAQAAIIPQSLRLVNDLNQAISGLRVPTLTGRASIGPIDSMTCPAAILEIAPTSAPASDPGYQQRVAESITQALVFWRGHAELNQPTPTPTATPTPATPTTTPKPKPKPKPKPVDPDNPDPVTPEPTEKPAPVLRKPPPATTPEAAPAPQPQGAGR